jgi:hypothetical protein
MKGTKPAGKLKECRKQIVLQNKIPEITGMFSFWDLCHKGIFSGST